MQRSELAHKIAATKCFDFHGETICSEELAHMVSAMLHDDVADAASATNLLSKEKKQEIANHLNDGAVNL